MEMRKNKKKGEVTYSDIEDIVEYLVKTKSRSYSFDCYAPDDIAQEIRVICLTKLKKFDPEKTDPEKWQNFFGRCVDNGLKNLKRDRYIRTASPHKKKFEDLDDDDTSDEAQKTRKLYAKFQKRIKIQLGIIHAQPISLVGDISNHCSFKENTEYKELEEYLIVLSPDNILSPLKKMLSGLHKDVSRRDKKKVQEFVKKILD